MVAVKKTSAAASSNGTGSSTAKTMRTTEDWSSGAGLIPGRDALGPLFLMLTTPAFSILFHHVCAHGNGDFWSFGSQLIQHGILTTMRSIWPSPWDAEACQMIAAFLLLEAFLMKYMPGATFEATLTPKGNRPTYKANGMQSYLFTLFLLLLLTYMDVIHPYRVYDKFGNILSTMNVLALLLCTVLLVKGHVAPSSTDSGTTHSWVMDFYWGMELYPRFFGWWDVKQFTNCRAGMMFWAVGIVCFAHKNMMLHDGTLQIGMAVNVALQLIYITKFFYWEMGYMCSMDIQHDRAGYYICWGCLVWVPAVYTSHSFYLAQHAPDLSLWTAAAIFTFGVVMIFCNYDSDHQRYVFRQTNGNCILWGKVPRSIVATYYSNSTTTTTAGTTNTSKQQQQTRTSLLLVDGYWRWSRHFHYVFEILASLAWSLPALTTGFVGPYFYVVYLTILLTDRAYRDDDRCRKKYGEYWEEYCAIVPYKIVPGII